MRRRAATPSSDNVPSTAGDQEPEDNTKQGIFSVPYLQACLFATVLEDAITEMRILVECDSELALIKTNNDMGLLRALKYSVALPKVTDELDGIDVRRLNCDEYKIEKLNADRNVLQNIFISTYLDLSLHRTFSSLATHVCSIVDKTNHYNFLIEDEAKNRCTRRELYRQLRQQRNHHKSQYYDTDTAIEALKSQVEDVAVNSEVRGRYVDNWQRARTEQHTELIRVKESKPYQAIEHYKQKTDHEQRIHTELELLTTIAINETLTKVESWMNKFDKDMEEIELKIQKMKIKHTAQLERRKNLEETLEKHAQLVVNWVDYKDSREKARLYREKMQHAAIVVQAWWRGLLVRNMLGPYKPVKKGKGAAKNKEKKEKE